MATADDLKQFLRENPPANKFVPYCYLSKESDSLTVYFEGDADYSERLNDHLTIYRSLETKEVVGCRVKGISGILEDMPNYIRVDSGDISLSLIFLAFRGGAEGEVREAVNTLACEAAEKGVALTYA